ncbi:22440_t:CDS:1 [Gigaspora margarita]|uniref:22440_t:CDS:1 n=1 Tax=Gigaspora margarita TaxID=4874 RepID=A0ABM8VXX1_GIGMA|nr:22440_t:CDS:1 [Gigaspora margarita]
MEIDFNINIYNNLPKVEKSPYQTRYNIFQPFFVSFDNTPRSNSTQYKSHPQHAHTCIIRKTKNIPCIILQNDKHSLDPNALTLKNQQLGFPAHPQCLYQLKLKPTQQQNPLNREQQNILYFLKFISLNKEQKKQLLLRTYNKFFVKKTHKKKENDQEQETHQNKEPKSKTSKYTFHDNATSQFD